MRVLPAARGEESEMSEDSKVVQAFAAMERHLAAAAVDLFEAYGISVRHSGSKAEAAETPADPSVIASIGYAGAKVRGALVMVASMAAVQSWLTALNGPDSAGDVCDTLGEFSNMLLGRLKGRLLREGFPILMSTPTMAFGSGFTLKRPVGPSTWLSFDGPGWLLGVRIDATFEDGFTLQAHKDREAPAEAGDLLLF
jgi:CheY-specific phosphatase CheX